MYGAEIERLQEECNETKQLIINQEELRKRAENLKSIVESQGLVIQENDETIAQLQEENSQLR